MTLPKPIEASKNLSSESILLWCGLCLSKEIVQCADTDVPKVMQLYAACLYLTGANNYIKYMETRKQHDSFWEENEQQN